MNFPREPVFAAGIGLGAAALVWLVVGLWVSEPRGLKTLEAARWPSSPAVRAAGSKTAIGSPIFASSEGPSATPEVALKLSGISRGPKDQAALVSINGGAPGWMTLGATKDGVTLVEVGASKVVIDTTLGFRTVTLGGDASPPAVGARR